MLRDTAQAPDSSILVVVDDASSAGPLLGWSLYQACRRHSGLQVFYAPDFPYADNRRIVDRAAVEQGRKALAATLGCLGAGSRASVETGGPDESTIEAIRARAVSERYGLVMVGPLATSTLVTLLFGSDGCGGHTRSELPLAVVPRSAWSTALPDSTPSRLTVGFHGSAPAVAALAWTIGEAERRDGVVCAVMAWCEGGYGGLGGPVEIVAALPSVVGRSAHRLAADSLSTCGLRTDRVSTIARRGMPAATLLQEARGSDLLVVGAGQSTVFGHRTLGAITLGMPDPKSGSCCRRAK